MKLDLLCLERKRGSWQCSVVERQILCWLCKIERSGFIFTTYVTSCLSRLEDDLTAKGNRWSHQNVFPVIQCIHGYNLISIERHSKIIMPIQIYSNKSASRDSQCPSRRCDSFSKDAVALQTRLYNIMQLFTQYGTLPPHSVQNCVFFFFVFSCLYHLNLLSQLSSTQLCSTISLTLRLYSLLFSLYNRLASELAGLAGFGSHNKL